MRDTHPSNVPDDRPARSAPAPWWRTAVVYQVYPRSFADSTGDGVGDLPGVTAHLDHLADLGVDGLWLSPVYASPMHDGGYDVADYRSVDPLFGTLADADALVAAAHDRGLKVLMDLVPNHTSGDHAWFREALAAAPGSAARARYLFRDGRGSSGEQPPNDWRSVFGGPAWERVTEADGTPGQWYLHLFDASQPDLDWSDPQVRGEFEAILRFWLDRGVDGFRVDVAHGLVKADGLPDWDPDVDPGATSHAAAAAEEVVVADTSSEEVYPAFAAVAAQHGIGSAVAIGLAVAGDATAALNVYRTGPGGADATTMAITTRAARVFAAYASVAVSNAAALDADRATSARLAGAMASRAGVEQAKGVLMAQRGVSAPDAFALLSAACEGSGLTLSEAAEQVIATVGGDGSTRS